VAPRLDQIPARRRLRRRLVGVEVKAMELVAEPVILVTHVRWCPARFSHDVDAT
jgi:hypothetical protein